MQHFEITGKLIVGMNKAISSNIWINLNVREWEKSYKILYILCEILNFKIITGGWHFRQITHTLLDTYQIFITVPSVRKSNYELLRLFKVIFWWSYFILQLFSTSSLKQQELQEVALDISSILSCKSVLNQSPLLC